MNNEHYTIYNGSMLDMLEIIEPNSIDSIVCDPPYELNFMGKGWDRTGIAFQPETWRKCYEVLKPGGYLLAFGGSRTFHRIAVAIEDAGFEIRDTIMYLYGTGFPKSLNIAKGIEAKLTTGSANKTQFSELNGQKLERGNWGITKNTKEYGFRKKDYTTETEKIHRLGELEPYTALANQWQGWGSCLKPAYEPIIVARKPFKGSLVENVMKYGTGGINIDESRVGEGREKEQKQGISNTNTQVPNRKDKLNIYPTDLGRFPANVIHDGSEETTDNMQDASRYFYTAKASKKDRDEGLGMFEDKEFFSNLNTKNGSGIRLDGNKTPIRKNIHPTVKPCELMQYLVRLVSPKGATILDPFMGSGSTGKAAMFENRERQADYKFIGIDLEEEYCNIASARIDYALNKYKYDFQREIQEAKERGQMSLF